MNFLSGLEHRKKYLSKLFHSDSGYLALVLFFVSIVLLSNVLTGLRTVTVFYLFISLFLYIKFKSFFISFFVPLVFSLGFFTPAKSYSVDVIPASAFLLPQLDEAYRLGYGINIISLFSFGSLVFFLRELWSNKKIFEKFKENVSILILIFSSFLFFCIGLYSSIMHSPFFELSFTWLLQYMMYLFFALFVYYLFLTKNLKFLFIPLFASSAFQFFVVLWQFFLQRSIGLAVEFGYEISQHYTGLDEVNTFARVHGTYLFHNQLSLLSLVLFSIFLIRWLYQAHGQKISEAISLMPVLGLFLIIVLTQTRIVWISLVFVVLVTVIFDTKNLGKYRKIFEHVNSYLVAFLLIALSVIFLPRLYGSVISDSIASGIGIRKEMIAEAVEVLQQSPVFGYGIATNEHILIKRFPMGVMSVFPTAVHLAFLQLALEVGLVGIVLFLTPFIFLLRQLLAHQKKNKYALMYICGILSFAIYYLFHTHVLIAEAPYLGMILGLGIIATYEK